MVRALNTFAVAVIGLMFYHAALLSISPALCVVSCSAQQTRAPTKMGLRVADIPEVTKSVSLQKAPADPSRAVGGVPQDMF